MDLAGEAGIDTKNGISDENVRKVQKAVNSFENMDEKEILNEIGKIKNTIKKDRKLYEQQLKAVKSLRPMMTAKQKARLDKIIGLLEN